jgi:hypothetical protein
MALRRISRLEQLALLRTAAGEGELDRRTSYVVIEAHTAWASFCRCYYLSSALGARDSAGLRVLPTAQAHATEESALTTAILAVSPRRQKTSPPWSWFDEPKWHMTRDFEAAMRALASTNVAAVSKALASTTPVFGHLPVYRHFYAHRSRYTAVKAQSLASSYLLPIGAHPTVTLNSFPPGSRETVLQAWLFDLRQVIAMMA